MKSETKIDSNKLGATLGTWVLLLFGVLGVSAYTMCAAKFFPEPNWLAPASIVIGIVVVYFTMLAATSVVNRK